MILLAVRPPAPATTGRQEPVQAMTNANLNARAGPSNVDGSHILSWGADRDLKTGGDAVRHRALWSWARRSPLHSSIDAIATASWSIRWRPAPSSLSMNPDAMQNVQTRAVATARSVPTTSS